MDWLHNDLFLKIAGAVVGVSVVGTQYLPPNTIGWKICAGAVALGVALGITSSTGREPKAKV